MVFYSHFKVSWKKYNEDSVILASIIILKKITLSDDLCDHVAL